MREFSDILDEAMVREDRTNGWLSRKTGISRSTIGDYRTGKTTPSIERAKLISNHLDLDLTQVFGAEGVKESQEKYNHSSGQNIPRKEGVVEIPLFPKALDLISGLHQSQNGLTIDLTMAKSRLPIAESLFQEGMFAVDTYHLVDCDDDYGIAAVIPWTGTAEVSKPILFTTEQAEKLYIRRVLVHEGGKFVFRESYKGSNSVLEREIEVLGILKLKIEQL